MEIERADAIQIFTNLFSQYIVFVRRTNLEFKRPKRWVVGDGIEVVPVREDTSQVRGSLAHVFLVLKPGNAPVTIGKIVPGAVKRFRAQRQEGFEVRSKLFLVREVVLRINIGQRQVRPRELRRFFQSAVERLDGFGRVAAPRRVAVEIKQAGVARVSIHQLLIFFNQFLPVCPKPVEVNHHALDVKVIGKVAGQFLEFGRLRCPKGNRTLIGRLVSKYCIQGPLQVRRRSARLELLRAADLRAHNQKRCRRRGHNEASQQKEKSFGPHISASPAPVLI